jgi:hypothetical protein
VQAATFRETKLICQMHIKKLYKMEPDGEEDTKVLATITEQDKKIYISLETAGFFMGIRNFNLKENEETTIYSDIGSWSATYKINDSDSLSERLTIDRNSGFITFEHEWGKKILWRGVGQCEKVNANVQKF